MRYRRLMVLLSLLAPGLCLAQAPDEWSPYVPSEPDPSAPPPLVPADPPPQPEAPAPRGEIISRQPDSQGGTALRLTVAPFSGAMTGMIGGIGGAIPGMLIALPFCAGAPDFDDNPGCAVSFLSVVSLGVTLGATTGVYFTGELFEGRGEFVPTLLGALTGLSIGAVTGIASEKTALILVGIGVGPVLGAIVGYELSHSWASEPAATRLQARGRLQVMPVLGAAPGGGVLGGLAGRF